MATDLNFVAHQDDDTLFQQPDIIDSYMNAGVHQTTVFLTCGNDTYWNDLVYLRRREQGAMDAYAQMGLIRSGRVGQNAGLVRWSVCRSSDYGPLQPTVADCIDFPDLHLVFIRLSGCMHTGDRWTQDFQGHTVEPVSDLEDLWEGKCSSLTAVDGSGTYDFDALVRGLVAILHRWTPRVIRTLDSSAPPSSNRDDPHWDHWDHYYSALFAQRAIEKYLLANPPVPECCIYRGYNIKQEPEKVFDNKLLYKQWLFYYYSYNDPHMYNDLDMSKPGKFDPRKVPPEPNWVGADDPHWLKRQYPTRLTL